MLCDLQFPKKLGDDFLRLMVPAAKDVNLGLYNGTCAIIMYKYDKNVVKNLTLREISCVDQVTSFICEVY